MRRMQRTSRIRASSGDLTVPHEGPTIAHAQARRRRPAVQQRRAPVRPLDDGATELVRVIEFVWVAGDAIQPVLLVERELLN